MTEPYPKSRQLGPAKRPLRAYRKRATKAEWAEIAAAKLGPCRVCCDPGHNGHVFGRIQLHHLVSRAQGGDDVADNIAPVCLACHDAVTTRRPAALQALALSLTETERGYIVGKLGEGALGRLFGV